MEFLVANWEFILLALFVAEKIVKVTPCKWDDIIIDGIKTAAIKMFAKKTSG